MKWMKSSKISLNNLNTLNNLMRKEIILIDDDPILRLIIQKMIHQIDSSIICYHCENGEVGLNVLEPFFNLNRPIMVLLDINMPILDGWSFLDILENKDFNTLKNIHLYIVSSSTDESDKLRASNYGLVKKLFHKPLYKEGILEILNGQ